MHKIEKKAEQQHLKNWIQNFKIANGRDAVYNDLATSDEYAKLIKDLIKEQGYICCYCEKEIGKAGAKDCEIEHFMPRHPDKTKLSPQECQICENAQLDYNNMFASCLGEEIFSLDHCNHKKDNWYDFKYCVHPTSDQIEKLFGFNLDGKIFALNNNMSGHMMRQHLNLDTYVLQQQRKFAFDAILEIEFGDEDELFTDSGYILETIKYYHGKDEYGKYQPFCSMITYCLENYVL